MAGTNDGSVAIATGAHTIRITDGAGGNTTITTAGGFNPVVTADKGAVAAHAAEANPHPSYMQKLLYDPKGKAANCFDLSNQDGALDAGAFN